ncbi:MAG: hypothetical protein CK604_00535 [Curvibacter sp. PD_MW3]|nr:MAG: hypothetical protein CK604_00535 [Curvibacter sp. PD_MW3]
MATSKLSDKLRPASFRGVPFHVEDAGIGVGRRAEVHSYPQRDKHWVEDLGRAPRELTIEGFLVGPDYVEQANRLLAALEEAGPGTLVHPWFGTLTVSLTELARANFNTQLGQARISMPFVESGDLEFPSVTGSTPAQSRLVAAGLEDAAVADFADTFDVAGYPDFVATTADADIARAFSLTSSGSVSGLDMLGFSGKQAGSLALARSQFGSPLSLGQTIAGYLSAAGLSSSWTGAALRWAPLALALVRLAGLGSLATPASPAVYTPSRQQVWRNASATNTLVRQVVLAQAVGAASLAPAAVYDETVGLRNSLSAALDAEALNASDRSYTALMDARAAVWRDLTERSRDSARLTTITPSTTEPALVVAYDFYEDAAREGDIVARNGIRHPGFVPPTPLKVLTR